MAARLTSSNKRSIRQFFFELIVFLTLIFPLSVTAQEEVGFTRHAADGQHLLLWFASERGFAPAEDKAAQDLAASGIEVWQVDLVNALFLPALASSLNLVDLPTVKRLMQRAVFTGKQVSVYASARAAVPALRALEGQQACLLLMHPNIYGRAEALDGADYLHFEALNKVNLVLLQPKRSAATPWVAQQASALGESGARVELLILDSLREGFWRRSDATPKETELGLKLADLIMQWMQQGKCF